MIDIFGQFVGFMPLEVAFDLEEAELLDQATLTKNGSPVAELSTYEGKPCLVYFHNKVSEGFIPVEKFQVRFREDINFVIVEV